MLPSSLLHFTGKGSLKIASYADIIEDSLRALTLLLPGRFEDSEICSQSILTVLNLASLYHTKQYHLDTTSSFNVRFVRLSRLCQLASWTLSIISSTEVLFEMLLVKKAVSRWKWVVRIEGIKAILRFVLFYSTNRSMVVHPTHLLRNIDPVAQLDPRTGIAKPTAAEPINRKSVMKSGWFQLSELLWIIRPLIYAYMVAKEQKYMTINADSDEMIEKEQEGLISWKPWLASLCIDLISRLGRHMESLVGGDLEKEESRRRDYLLLYYLLKGPIYLKLTRNLLEKFCDSTEHRPLISIITAAINDYRPFWEETYFYTSGS
ncbi:MAG: peroxisome membrane protein [Benjaminiella poitrasii]|nr:MAG: peroxisome membrane protein [Benjaminiella poitrasii]